MDENYPQAVGKYAGEVAQLQARRLDITLRQNIDEQIKQAEARVAALQATKQRLETSGILDAQIEDIRSAMRF